MRTGLRCSVLLMLFLVLGAHRSAAQWVKTGNLGFNTISPPSPYALVATDTAAADTDVFAGTTGGVFVSTNEGTSWSNTPAGIGFVMAFAVHDTFLFAATGAGIYRSTNNGHTWAIAESSLSYLYVTSIAVSGENIFAGANGVWRSTNNGTSWTAVNSGLTDSTATTVTAIVAAGSNLFVGTNDGSGIFRSTNNGATWTPASTGITKGVSDTTEYIHIYALAAIGSTVFAGTENGVFVSTNNGASWNSANTNITPNSDFYPFAQISCFAVTGTTLLAATTGGSPAGVYVSTNMGETWTAQDSGLTHVFYTALLVAGGRAYAANEGGVYSRPQSEMNITGIRRVKDNIPGAFSLSQNYPNPFNPTTNFEFRTANIGFVSLKIFDVLGREVATLVNEQKPAGVYNVSWDASNVPSGVYFYRMQAGAFTQTKKLVLMK